MTFCSKCGKALEEGAVFCPACGTRVQSAQASAAPAGDIPHQDPPRRATPPVGRQAPRPSGAPVTPPPVQPSYGGGGWQSAPGQPSGAQYGGTARPRTGLNAAGIILLVAAALMLVLWLTGSTLINTMYTMPATLVFLILGVMCLVLARSPKQLRGILGKAAGISQSAFAALCVALAIALPVLLFVTRLAPGSALLGTWIPEGYDMSDRYSASLEFTLDSKFTMYDGDQRVTGTWTYVGDSLTLTPDALSALTVGGMGSVTLSVDVSGDWMQMRMPFTSDEGVGLYRAP